MTNKAMIFTCVSTCTVISVFFYVGFLFRGKEVVAAPLASNDLFETEPNFYFGRVWKSETVKHRFVVKNISPKRIVLSAGLPSCACTVASTGDGHLTPEGTTYLDGEVEIGEQVGTLKSAIPIRASVEVGDFQSGDVSQDKILKLSADVDDSFGVSPSKLDFQNIRKDPPAQDKSFRLTLPLGFSIESTKINSFDDNMAAAIRIEISSSSVEKERNVFAGKIVIAPTSIPPSHRELSATAGIIVKNSEGTRRTLTLHITANVVDDISSTPDTLFWPHASRSSSHFVIIESVSSQPFTIVDIRDEDNSVIGKVSAKTVSGYKVDFRLRDGVAEKDGVIRRMIKIKVRTGTGFSEITLPLLAL